MITKISIIGKLSNGETRTACVSVKGRRFSKRDMEKLLEKDSKYIEVESNNFESLEVCLELKKNQWSKPLKEKMIVETIDSLDEKLDILLTMLMIADYEMVIGRFKDCSF